MSVQEHERLRRWRLVLGSDAETSLGPTLDSDRDRAMDQVLDALYNSGRKGALGSSCPNVNRWLGDIRTYFPSSVVQVMQNDALNRLQLHQMLLEPEMLESVQSDVHLVATLMTLRDVIPEKAKKTARQVVKKVVEELQRKLQQPMIQAIKGSLNRASRTHRPKPNEIDWNRTIRKNLKNYQPKTQTIIAEQLVGYGRKRSSLRDVVLCVDQSGSMGTSVVYSGIFGAVMASMSAVNTRMVVFDTQVADLTEELTDPVELLFGVQLGGGTDINRAVAYCQQMITRPGQTIMVLISDLFEGGVEEELLRRTATLLEGGVQFICLLALSDDGAPAYNHELARELADMGVPSFACTPDLFPDLMAAAINRQDLGQWASRNQIVTAATV